VHFVRQKVDDFVFIWFGISKKYNFEFPRLMFEVFFSNKTRNFIVYYIVYAILGDSCYYLICFILGG